jgi:hypothetical protein
MMPAKTIAFALFVCVMGAAPCKAGDMHLLSPPDLIVRADWQEPAQLPPRFRNHCRAENFTGRPYCSDHCGADYQFFYCSQGSFGCCRPGHGYCDWDGLLRCAP